MQASAPAVGVIGTGAMGMGVVLSLLRHGFATHARDVRADVQRDAIARGATGHPDAASLAAVCEICLVLVVDSAEVDDVLFGPGGAIPAFRGGSIVVLSSTVDPNYVRDLAQRFLGTNVTLVDAPVSGGPRRAADGTMTVMTAGASDCLARCGPVLAAIAGRVINVGSAPGEAATFKILNNMLAAANLAAGAEALALAERAGINLDRFVEVVNASSGASWIFADRMPRAIAGDFAPRAAARILAKDVRIAAELAVRLGHDAAFANAARDTFEGMVEAGLGELDDAAICRYVSEVATRRRRRREG